MSTIPKADTLEISGPSKPTPDTPEGGDFAIMDGGTNVIAEVFHRISEDRTQDAQAIAALFAAAPDLLEALKGVLRVADRATDEFDAARAAIAKATEATT